LVYGSRETLVGEEEGPVSSEENMALVRRFLEARAKADLNAIEEMLAPDFISHNTPAPGQQLDRESYMRQVAESVSAFSDVRFVIEEQVAAGDKVVSRISGRGTHVRSELLGTTPTGREIASIAIFIHRLFGGKISEEWGAGTGRSELLSQRLEQEIRERERVEQELRVARSIQQASLPKEVPTLEGWQISPLYQPAREVGGDFYDFFELEGGKVGLAVGDATGKGMPAALAVTASSSMLRAVAQDSSYSPGEVMGRVNETLLARIPPNMFVTCFYAILDPESGHLSYANAGHDLPYLRRRGGEAEELRARGMPLGLMPGMSYEEKETILEAGQTALFYSDGLVEAHDPEGGMFGFPRLWELVAEHGEEKSLGRFLLEQLYSFVGESWEQEDDITLLTLRRLTASR
jgi:serine phosphatase RsbU (regulator of sigma subunit)/predicted ester cyclase